MEKTLKLLANQGATFANAVSASKRNGKWKKKQNNALKSRVNVTLSLNTQFTSSPICCPSRASILSGQYAHNHATSNNSMSGGCYGSIWKEHIEPRTFPVQLQNSGYRTFYAGKYLNRVRLRQSAIAKFSFITWFCFQFSVLFGKSAARLHRMVWSARQLQVLQLHIERKWHFNEL